MNTLYHYTGSSGILGILESRALWATDGNFLNDTSEGAIPHLILREIADPENIWMEPDAYVRQWLQQKRSEVPRKRFFVACFCSDGDLLSQWRGYASGHTGYAIGFDRDVLRDCMKHDGEIYLRECKYFGSEDQAALEHALSTCIKSVQAEAMSVREREGGGDTNAQPLNPLLSLFELSGGQKSVADRLLDEFWRSAIEPLFRDRAFLKQKSFFEEHEERIVITDNRSVHYRAAKNGLVPYTKIDLRDVFARNGVKEIIIGPASDGLRARRGIEQYLADNGLSGIKVCRTEATLTLHGA